MQRDRRFASYEDIEARYERRPSAWVRPLGDWGAGRVELVQLRTPDETHDNIVAYWVPATLPEPGQPMDIAYELSWQGDAQQTPPGAWVVQSRRGYGYTKLSASEQLRQPQFVLDFAGPALEGLAPDAPVRAIATADANGRIVEAHAYPNPTQRVWPGRICCGCSAASARSAACPSTPPSSHRNSPRRSPPSPCMKPPAHWAFAPARATSMPPSCRD